MQHDLIVGADGIGSAARGILGILPAKRPAEQSCLHANVSTEQAVKLGLVDYSQNEALEYWGGQEGKWDKIVLSPCNGGKLLSYYCFFAREQGDFTNHTWGGDDLPVEDLLAPYPHLDRQVLGHLKIGKEITSLMRLLLDSLFINLVVFLCKAMWHIRFSSPKST